MSILYQYMSNMNILWFKLPIKQVRYFVLYDLLFVLGLPWPLGRIKAKTVFSSFTDVNHVEVDKEIKVAPPIHLPYSLRHIHSRYGMEWNEFLGLSPSLLGGRTEQVKP